MRLRVIKLGGSLLNLPDLESRVREWLAQQEDLKSIFLIGGGQLIETVRELDGIHRLEPQFVHWLCVDLLKTTAHLACKLFPDFSSLETPEDLTAFVDDPQQLEAKTAIVNASAFYSEHRTDCRLVEGWATTTDSIAALLAHDCDAKELVLLKSANPPSDCSSFEELAAASYVDSEFPTIASGLRRVRMVNLRDGRD